MFCIYSTVQYEKAWIGQNIAVMHKHNILKYQTSNIQFWEIQYCTVGDLF